METMKSKYASSPARWAGEFSSTCMQQSGGCHYKIEPSKLMDGVITTPWGRGSPQILLQEPLWTVLPPYSLSCSAQKPRLLLNWQTIDTYGIHVGQILILWSTTCRVTETREMRVQHSYPAHTQHSATVRAPPHRGTEVSCKHVQPTSAAKSVSSRSR